MPKKKDNDETTIGGSQENLPVVAGPGIQENEVAPATQSIGAADILKLLTGAVQAAAGNSVAVRNSLPCLSSDEESPSFGAVSEKIVEAVTVANSGAAGNSEFPFSTLFRLCGKRLGEDLADRSKRPKVLSEILAAQVRDGALTCELLNSSLYGMTHGEIVKSISEGKGKLQNILALRHQSEKAVHSSIEIMNAVDEATYPAVKVRQRRSVKVRVEKPGGKKVTMTGSEMQETKNRQLQ